jgi:hypothetical protein
MQKLYSSAGGAPGGLGGPGGFPGGGFPGTCFPGGAPLILVEERSMFRSLLHMRKARA